MIRTAEGIVVRHARSCPSEPCRCDPTYQANVWLPREKRRVFKTFPSLAAAKSWRLDALGAIKKGKMRSPSQLSVRAAADAWLVKAKAEAVRTRGGSPYKPSALRGYEQALRDRIPVEFGAMRLSDVTRGDVQSLIEDMLSENLHASTIRNAIIPLRAIFRHGIERGELAVNPTANLTLPAVRSQRERTADPGEAAALLAVLPSDVQAIYATAFYAGLRRGELMALRWEDVALSENVIHVRQSYDPPSRSFVEPKSAKGRRDVPIPELLRDLLVEHGLETERTGSDLVFGRAASEPFTPTHVRRLALGAWDSENARQEKAARPESERLIPIGLHEARHTYVSIMVAAGVPLQTVGDFVGHSSATMTDRYRHLLKDAGKQAAAAFDAYLEQQQTV